MEINMRNSKLAYSKEIGKIQKKLYTIFIILIAISLSGFILSFLRGKNFSMIETIAIIGFAIFSAVAFYIFNSFLKKIALALGYSLSINEIINLAPDAFFHGDSAGNFIDVNDAAEILTGYSREELLSMNMRDLFEEKELSERPLRYDLLDSGTILKENGLLNAKMDLL